jgi:hypothetical protein
LGPVKEIEVPLGRILGHHHTDLADVSRYYQLVELADLKRVTINAFKTLVVVCLRPNATKWRGVANTIEMR